MVAEKADIVVERALPGSGTIRQSQVIAEFNKGNNLRAYLGAATGVPSSGNLKLTDFYGKSAVPSPNPGPIYSDDLPVRGATTALGGAPYVAFPSNTQWYDACTMFIFDFGVSGFPDAPNSNWERVSDQAHGGLWGSQSLAAFALKGGYRADRDGAGVQIPARTNRFVALYSWNTGGIPPAGFEGKRSWSASSTNLKTGWTNGNVSNIQMYAVTGPGSPSIAGTTKLNGPYESTDSAGLAYTCSNENGATIGCNTNNTCTAGWMEMKIT